MAWLSSVRRIKAYYPLLRAYSTRTSRVLRPPSPQFASLLADFLSQEPRPLTLSRLLSYGQPLSRESLLSSAAYVHSEIPRRLARRIRALESLPFIVGTNPYVARTLETHRESFQWLAMQRRAGTLEENTEFSVQLEQLVQSHANDIPTLAKGFQECRRYMSQNAITDFLDHTIRNRIAVRLIAEQHIALTWALKSSADIIHHNGVVNVDCSPTEMINLCSSVVHEMCEATLGTSPRVLIDGYVDANFAYVPIHLQYVVTELLKNAFRATVEKHSKSHGLHFAGSLPPIAITISPFPRESSPTYPSFMFMRIRDEGGGISSSDLPHVFSYAFTTASNDSRMSDETDGGPYAAQHVGGSAAIGSGGNGGAGEPNLFGEFTSKGVQTGVGTLAGLGYGLPMSRLYAKYFGGSLDLFSLDGWGTDVVLKLRCLRQGGDSIEI